MPKTKLDALAKDIKRPPRDKLLELIVGRYELSGMKAEELAAAIDRTPHRARQLLRTPSAEWKLGRLIQVAELLDIPLDEFRQYIDF